MSLVSIYGEIDLAAPIEYLKPISRQQRFQHSANVFLDQHDWQLSTGTKSQNILFLSDLNPAPLSATAPSRLSRSLVDRARRSRRVTTSTRWYDRDRNAASVGQRRGCRVRPRQPARWHGARVMAGGVGMLAVAKSARCDGTTCGTCAEGWDIKAPITAHLFQGPAD
jgi:hypothetical protein